jgi:hypothetical protein
MPQVPSVRFVSLVIGSLSFSVASLLASSAGASPAGGEPAVVTYEMFGAVGDGVADDLPAIVAAHAEANAKGLPVRARGEATYHLGAQALTAVIQTNTDWNTARFIIDDSRGVENHKRPLFEVRSRLAPEKLAITRLAAGQARLDVRPAHDCLVLVENDRLRRFIRRGRNQNAGTPQHEVFILRRDGSVEGAIEWDYETVTRVEARPIDPDTLVIRGGVFTHVANQMKQPKGYNYWGRNIEIRRSNTEVDGVTLQITGEGEFGHPYNGFLRAEQVANITFRNCRLDGRKVYSTIGSAGEPVPMGTYGYRADLVVNFRMLHCGQGNSIHDRSRWGVATSNFIKNVLVEDCVLSRMDVHMGVSSGYVIRRTTLGHQGLKAIGRGELLLEDATVHADNLIDFRADYGSTWDGDVLIRNSRWILPADVRRNPAMFGMQNDGTHDFGYPCRMPRTIRIEGLSIDDSALKAKGGAQGVALFADPAGKPVAKRPFPYRLTEKLVVRDLKTASGKAPRVSDNAEIAKAIRPEAE